MAKRKRSVSKRNTLDNRSRRAHLSRLRIDINDQLSVEDSVVEEGLWVLSVGELKTCNLTELFFAIDL